MKRFLHLAMILVGLGAPVAAAVVATSAQLPGWAKVGGIFAGVAAVLASLQTVFAPDADAAGLIRRVAHGTLAAIGMGVPILTAVLSALPPTGKEALLLGALLGLAASIKVAFAPLDDAKSSLGPVAPAVILLLGSLLFAGQAQAQATRDFGGCIKDGAVCFGPSAAVTVGQYNLTTGKFLGGVIPGVGYGATFFADQWYQAGLSFQMAFTVGSAAPNSAVPGLMLSFADYVRVGAGLAVTEQTSGGPTKEWLLRFGFGKDFGGPGPVAAYKAQRARVTQ